MSARLRQKNLGAQGKSMPKDAFGAPQAAPRHRLRRLQVEVARYMTRDPGCGYWRRVATARRSMHDKRREG
jgi:hypothetical protein